jgi:hypothetical protein
LGSQEKGRYTPSQDGAQPWVEPKSFDPSVYAQKEESER